MRKTVAFAVLSGLAGACGDGGDEDTGFGEGSTSAPTTMMAADDSSSEGGTTDATFECDANVEIAVADGVELGAHSVEAVRFEADGDVQYTVSLIGDAEGTTQMDIIFTGTPVAGEEYMPIPFMMLDVARVELLPEQPGDIGFQSGTLTYTMVGTAEGEIVALEFDFEFTRGPIAGCVYTDLTVQAG